MAQCVVNHMWIQIVLLIVIVSSLFLTWKRFIQGSLQLRESIVWTLVWIAAGVAVSRPEVTTVVAHLVGVGRGVDLALYASVIILFCLVFHLHVLNDKMQRTFTELVRHQALHDLENQVKQRTGEDTPKT